MKGLALLASRGSAPKARPLYMLCTRHPRARRSLGARIPEGVMSPGESVSFAALVSLL